MHLNNENENCFQILGYDVLIDKKGNAYVLEVNAHPSMNLNHTFKLDKEQAKLVDNMQLPEEVWDPKRQDLTVPSAIDVYLKTNILSSVIGLMATMSKRTEV